jgi:2-keto-4-pentenoate hydratase/2-oxohepta-3-ene-1,7-dioic acid hydratase in catechol pathway
VDPTADSFDGTQRVRCWVNGEPRQDASTTDLIDIPTDDTCSRGITLYPGDASRPCTPATSAWA